MVDAAETLQSDEINEVRKTNKLAALLAHLTPFFISHIVREAQILIGTLLHAEEVAGLSLLLLRVVLIVVRHELVLPQHVQRLVEAVLHDLSAISAELSDSFRYLLPVVFLQILESLQRERLF